MSKDVGSMFDPAMNGGQELTDTSSAKWPTDVPVEGEGVTGKVKAYESFKGDAGDSVGVVILSHAIGYKPVSGSAGGELASLGDVRVNLTAGLRRKVTANSAPVGSFLTIRYTGTDAMLNNMRTFSVHLSTREHLGRLHKAVNPSAGE